LFVYQRLVRTICVPVVLDCFERLLEWDQEGEPS